MAKECPPNSLPLKVMIDQKKRRVVFAEANASFVDTLFSFLTLPLGTVVKILRSHQYPLAFGCINNLYQSVESLHEDTFENSICKKMLLNPKNAAGYVYRSLKVKVDADDWGMHEIDYFCPDHNSFSLYQGLRCFCSKQMTNKVYRYFQTEPSAFVDERIVLLMDDCMRLVPLATTSIMALLQAEGLTNRLGGALEEKVVYIEVFKIFVSVFFSETPLTDLVFPPKLPPCEFRPNTTSVKIPKEEVKATAESNAKKFQIKLVLRKSDRKLLYAETGSGFIDMVFSFLTIPTGAVAKLMDGNFPRKSLNFIYNSIKDLGNGNHIKCFYNCRALLLDPKLAPHFKCDNQILDLVELGPPGHSKIIEGHYRDVIPQNPKKPGYTCSGGNFLKVHERFMLFDDLVVKPLSSASVISLLDDYKVSVGDVEEMEVSVGKSEGQNLLKASLVSRTGLSDVFIPLVLL